MKNKNTRRGFTQINWVGQALPDNAPAKRHTAAFTLIELLVVVLIIGILAAVAVPQYQKAVEKSKATEALIALKSVYEAQQLYHLEHGQYARNFSQLNIPFSWTGKEQFRGNCSDLFSNEEWSICIENNGVWQNIIAIRLKGPYSKAAGFEISMSSGITGWPLHKIFCVEIAQDIKSPYCKKLWQGTRPSLQGVGTFVPYLLP